MNLPAIHFMGAQLLAWWARLRAAVGRGWCGLRGHGFVYFDSQFRACPCGRREHWAAGDWRNSDKIYE